MYKCKKCSKKSISKANLKCDRCTPSRSNNGDVSIDTSNPFAYDDDSSRISTASDDSSYSGGGGSFDGGGASGDY